MGHRRGPSVTTGSSAAIAAGRFLTTVENLLFRLDGTGRFHSRVQAWNNPAYDGEQQGDTAITVDPLVAVDLIEEDYPDYQSMFRRMMYQFGAVLVLIVAHIMVIAYTDPIYIKSPLTQVIVYSGQGGLLLAIIGGFFVLTSQTIYIRYGRYDIYLRKFAAIYLMFAVEAVLFVAIKTYATVLLYKRMSYLAMWYAPGYTPLWVAWRVLLVLFWAAAAYSSFSVFDARYFDPDKLFGGEQKARGRRRRRVEQAATRSG